MALAPSTRTLSYAQFDQYKLSLLVLSITFVGNITANNMSLVHIGLSVNQVPRAPLRRAALASPHGGCAYRPCAA